ncbi:cytochrome P450 [Mycena rebaudengoi]|nr:cytochrome P450 [Mycena rebaudengoi]
MAVVKFFASALGAYAFYELLKIVYGELTSSLRSLPGPKSAHWLYGNYVQLALDKDSRLELQWAKQYGRILRFNGFFGFTELYLSDPKALHHILSNNHIYQKSAMSRYYLGRIVGPGILVVEGDDHKQQRKIMNPAFGAPQVRELTGIFVEKSIQLRDIWIAEAAQNAGVGKVDALSWLSRATLDIIGLAGKLILSFFRSRNSRSTGFSYDFNTLDVSKKRDEFVEAFTTITSTKMSSLDFLQARFPIFRVLPTKWDATVRESQEVIMRIGRQLLHESKKDMKTNENRRGQDLLSLLVRANTANELPPSQRLSDEDVLAQVPTFLVAGHETTSTAATWALFALTQNMAVQTRLRDELLTISTDNPTMDELNALPFLDCVVRETLRLDAPVTGTSRISMHEDVVPLGTPYTDTNGRGQTVTIPIFALNRDPEIWGPDASEFRPERWESSTPINNAIPGVWGHMLTFLGGPRGCIGYRFSLVELKALLFTLVRGLEFELAVPAADIGIKMTPIVRRPIVLTDVAAGNQLPLLVRPFVRS